MTCFKCGRTIKEPKPETLEPGDYYESLYRWNQEKGGFYKVGEFCVACISLQQTEFFINEEDTDGSRNN